jgi:hypothetical protein
LQSTQPETHLSTHSFHIFSNQGDLALQPRSLQPRVCAKSPTAVGGIGWIPQPTRSSFALRKDTPWKRICESWSLAYKSAPTRPCIRTDGPCMTSRWACDRHLAIQVHPRLPAAGMRMHGHGNFLYEAACERSALQKGAGRLVRQIARHGDIQLVLGLSDIRSLVNQD